MSTQQPMTPDTTLPASPTSQRSPYLGRGGLLGPEFRIGGLQFNRHIEALRVYILTSLWLLIIVEFFTGLVLLLPLKLLGPWGRNAYVRLALWWDWFSQGAILVVPFSWCGCTVYTSSWAVACKSKGDGSSLWMSNHGSRVDWLIGLLLGYIEGRPQDPAAPRVHVRFIAEFTTALMPLAGWSRFLLDDIYLRRTFHRDKVNIKRKLTGYLRVFSPRMLFFAPEGAIADVGNAQDARYVDACEAFMTELGREPMKFLLTPRYKGLSVFAEHSPTNIVSATMVFVTPTEPFARDITFADDGRVMGGSLCSLPLRDPARVVPDIHTVFGGGLHVFTTHKAVALPSEEEDDSSAAPDGSPAKKAGHALRDVLLDDYTRKDGELACFHKERRFTNVTSREDWVPFPVPHLKMNIIVTLYAILGVSGVSAVWRLSLYGACMHCASVWATLVVLHAMSHMIGVAITGHHRESLPGESAFKAIVETFKGGLNHGSTKKREKAAKDKAL